MTWGNQFRSSLFGLLLKGLLVAGLGVTATGAWARSDRAQKGDCIANAAALFRQPEAALTRQQSKPVLRSPALRSPALRYPARLAPDARTNEHIMFGFEGEYPLSDASALLRDYVPEGMDAAAWLQLPDAERIAFVQSNLKQLFPTARSTGGLMRAPHAPAFLPERLLLDATGNLEIVLKPVNSKEELFDQADFISHRYGNGSMQASVSVTRSSFFGSSFGVPRAQALDGIEGYFQVISDLDALSKLVHGFERYQKDPSKAVALSFQHPYLGPLTKQKRQLLRQTLEQHIDGEGFAPELLRMVTWSDASYKYIGSTAYRPDVAPNRVILETRDAHTHLPTLKSRVERSVRDLEQGLEGYAVFREAPDFDAQGIMERLPAPIRDALNKTFPVRARPGEEYTPAELEALSVANNFTWPLRDFARFMRHQKPNFQEIQTVWHAQNTYLSRIGEISERLNNNVIDTKRASLEFQGALATFAAESRLLEFYSYIFERVHLRNADGVAAAIASN